MKDLLKSVQSSLRSPTNRPSILIMPNQLVNYIAGTLIVACIAVQQNQLYSLSVISDLCYFYKMQTEVADRVEDPG